jgi:hypothetical protein
MPKSPEERHLQNIERDMKDMTRILNYHYRELRRIRAALEESLSPHDLRRQSVEFHPKLDPNIEPKD